MTKRNDPCPCKSGDKFKKCCGKESGLATDSGINSLTLLIKKANSYRDQGESEQALHFYQEALTINPESAETLVNLGVLYKELGEIEDSSQCYIKALAINPESAEAYIRFSTVHRFDGTEKQIGTMEELLFKQSISTIDRVYLGIALGKVYEDLGDYDKSFRYINDANQHNRQTFNHQINDSRKLFATIKETFTKDFMRQLPDTDMTGTTPIFILGMPRSGTSLVEQLLSAHPDVFGAGELDLFQSLILKHTGARTLLDAVQGISSTDRQILTSIGNEYLAGLRDKAQADIRFITDKMPHNFLFIPLIHLCLPSARIVHCLRNPMDNCWSLFKNYFVSRNHNYSYDLQELGQYYMLYIDLINNWNKLIPGVIHEVQYENLVNNTETESRKLLQHCNLPWSEKCLAFQKVKRRVATASAAQVRRPIYHSSIGIWRRYEQQLSPLHDIVKSACANYQIKF